MATIASPMLNQKLSFMRNSQGNAMKKVSEGSTSQKMPVDNVATFSTSRVSM